jgi:hypothetical protein
MSSGCASYRLAAVVAVAVAIMTGAYLPASAQQDFPARGGDVRSSGTGAGVGSRGGDIRGGGIGPGIGVGVGIGLGIGQQLLGQPPTGGPRQPSGKDSKSGTTKNADSKQPPRATQQVWEPLVYRTPGTNDCHDCDELLALILKYQALIAEDEKVLADLTKANKLNQLAGINRVLNEERDFLARLLDQYKDCVKRNCPQPPKRHLSIVHVDTSLLTVPGTDIDCGGHKGKIVVHTGVNIHWDRKDAHPEMTESDPKTSKGDISISYQGSGCDDCVWVQFVWTEVSAQVAGEKALRRGEGRITTTSGSYDLTTDPDHPNYNVDSASKETPAYEATGTSNVDANSSTIFDLTGNPFVDQDGNIFPAFPFNDMSQNYQTITWIDHLDTFLVCNGQVCGKVSWQVTYTWHAGQPQTVTGPDVSVTSVSPNGKPNIAQYQALTAGYGK